MLWLVDGILEKGSLNLLFGEPGAGKSLFSLDWAFCMAHGIEWHGHRTQETDVVIVAGEGFAGLSRRLRALEGKYLIMAPDNLYITQRPADFMDANNVKWLAETIFETCENPGLIIIDTLHRNMVGDENSSQDIASFIANVDRFIKPLGAAVLIVHHSGHGDKTRSRGSSSIRAAMDCEFSATKSDSGITLANIHKAKDFEAFKPLQFALKPANLGWWDDDGEYIWSVYLEQQQADAMPVRKSKPLDVVSRNILTAMHKAINELGIEPPKEVRSLFPDSQHYCPKKVIHIDDFRCFAYPFLNVADDSKRNTLKRTIEKLEKYGKAMFYNGLLWCVTQ